MDCHFAWGILRDFYAFDSITSLNQSMIVAFSLLHKIDFRLHKIFIFFHFKK